MTIAARHLTLPVTGMTCANCAAKIERNVRKLPGIALANVNLASEKLAVTFDPAQLDERAIIARIEKAGYGVAIGSWAFTVFMAMLELLVAFIQAYVFTFLSAMYIGAAVEEPHHH